eukprot:83283_1
MAKIMIAMLAFILLTLINASSISYGYPNYVMEQLSISSDIAIHSTAHTVDVLLLQCMQQSKMHLISIIWNEWIVKHHIEPSHFSTVIFVNYFSQHQHMINAIDPNWMKHKFYEIISTNHVLFKNPFGFVLNSMSNILDQKTNTFAPSDYINFIQLYNLDQKTNVTDAIIHELTAANRTYSDVYIWNALNAIMAFTCDELHVFRLQIYSANLGPSEYGPPMRLYMLSWTQINVLLNQKSFLWHRYRNYTAFVVKMRLNRIYQIQRLLIAHKIAFEGVRSRKHKWRIFRLFTPPGYYVLRELSIIDSTDNNLYNIDFLLSECQKQSRPDLVLFIWNKMIVDLHTQPSHYATIIFVNHLWDKYIINSDWMKNKFYEIILDKTVSIPFGFVLNSMSIILNIKSNNKFNKSFIPEDFLHFVQLFDQVEWWYRRVSIDKIISELMEALARNMFNDTFIWNALNGIMIHHCNKLSVFKHGSNDRPLNSPVEYGPPVHIAKLSWYQIGILLHPKSFIYQQYSQYSAFSIKINSFDAMKMRHCLYFLGISFKDCRTSRHSKLFRLFPQSITNKTSN